MTKQNNKNDILNLFIGIGILAILLGLNLVIQWFFSIENEQSRLFKQILLIVNTSIITIVAIRFSKSLFNYYDTRRNRNKPELFRSLVNFIILFIAVAYVITSVFGLPLWSSIAAGGIIGAGVAFALQGPILDFFTGIVLDLEKPFKVGDWIEIPKQSLGKSETVGRVISRTWRTTTVMPATGVYVTIPNHHLSNELFVNYHMPEKNMRDSITLILDYSIPVKRAVRLLKSCLISIEVISKHNDCLVLALDTSPSGVSYTLIYTIDDYTNWAIIKHNVVEKVTSTLEHYGIKLSQNKGAYATYELKDLENGPKLSFYGIAEHIDLFKALSKEELKKLSSKIKQVEFDEGDIVFSQGDKGDSMFIIGEGAIEVYEERKIKGKTSSEFLAYLGPMDYFGDMALLTGEPRTAYVKAKTSLIVFEIKKNDIKPILEQRPEIMEKLSKIVAQRQMNTQEVIEKSSKREIEEVNTLSDQILKGIKNYFKI